MATLEEKRVLTKLIRTIGALRQNLMSMGLSRADIVSYFAELFQIDSPKELHETILQSVKQQIAGKGTACSYLKGLLARAESAANGIAHCEQAYQQRLDTLLKQQKQVGETKRSLGKTHEVSRAGRIEEIDMFQTNCSIREKCEEEGSQRLYWQMGRIKQMEMELKENLMRTKMLQRLIQQKMQLDMDELHFLRGPQMEELSLLQASI